MGRAGFSPPRVLRLAEELESGPELETPGTIWNLALELDRRLALDVRRGDRLGPVHHRR